MGTFYPVKVEIDPASMPTTGKIPIWNGSIFELKPILGAVLITSQEPSVITDDSYTSLSTSYAAIHAPTNTSLDNSVLNNCTPSTNLGSSKPDSFVWGGTSGWVKFTYNINVNLHSYLFEMRVMHYDFSNSTSVVILEDAYEDTQYNSVKTLFGEVYWLVDTGDYIYVEARTTNNTQQILLFSFTCTNAEHSF